MHTDITKSQTEAAAVAAIQEGSLAPVNVTLDAGDGLKGEIYVAPNGQGGWGAPVTAKALLEPYRTHPERRKGTARFTELSSFCEHTNRFKDEGSVVFAEVTAAPKLLAVLDYHPQGSTSKPRFGVHRSLYEFPMSREWTAWTHAEGKALTQDQFALFLEDRLVDVVDPTNGDVSQASVVTLFRQALGVKFAEPGELLALSRGLTVHATHKATQTFDPQSGTGTLHFHEEHNPQDQRGQSVKVPGAFIITIPVFRGGDPFIVPVRLRYRLNGAQFTWTYDLFARDRVLDKSIRDACDKVAEVTGLPVLMGAPEQKND